MKRPLLLLALLVAGAFWRLGDLQAQTATPAPLAFGRPFSLTDQYRAHRTDKDFRGKYMLVFFGYTSCPDACPIALAVEAQALDTLGARAGRIAPIFVSVDTKRDTPDKLKSYLAAFDAKPPSPRLPFVGLTGSDREIAELAKAYHVSYRTYPNPHPQNRADYSIDHTSNIYLMSPEGKFLAYYSPGISPDEMAADLKRKVPG